MEFLPILFLIVNLILGIIVVNYFLPFLSRLAKVAGAFFFGIYISTIFVYFLSFITKDLVITAWIVMIAEILLLAFIFRQKRHLLSIDTKKTEKLLLVLFFCFGWYIMQKGFSYASGNFQIASNLYLDFGWVHLPIIRSFSEGSNIPPTFPFAAGIPLIYHFFFDFAVALYEKLGMRIDIAYNLLSAMSFGGVLLLIYSLSQAIFGKKPVIGILAVLLFTFNSSLSFIEVLRIYWGPDFLIKLYNHNIYLGNGPSGESIVSIFWNLNTYLNQRHFTFSLGIFLILVHVFYYLLSNNNKKFPWIFLGILVGLLPFWHSNVFLAIIGMGSVATVVLFLLKKGWKQLFFFLLLSSVIALPQILFIKNVQTIHMPFLTPGFLLANSLTPASFSHYWFYNLGISIFLIPLGVFLAKKEQRLFFLPIVLLFFVSNLFQFSLRMFDNHKFLNMFILLANIYSSSVLYLLFKKRLMLKTLAFVLFFFLIFSGIIDFLVVKNDIKTKIVDYPNNRFLTWIKKNTDPHAVFLTNKEIYDPITFVGRQSFLGRPHYLFNFGVSPDERLQAKVRMLSGQDFVQSTKLFKKYKIKYIVLYEQHHPLEKQLKTLYRDKTHLVLEIP